MHTATLMLSGSVVGLWAFGSAFAGTVISKISGL